MIEHQIVVATVGASPAELYTFLANPSDDAYQQWWPGVHLRFHIVKTGRSGADRPVGDVVMFDEWVGRRRVILRAVVAEAEPGRRLVWRVRLGPIPLPAWLEIEVRATPEGTTVDHRLSAGWEGRLGAVSDPLLRRYLSDRFRSDLTEHAQAEFPRLAALLRSRRGA